LLLVLQADLNAAITRLEQVTARLLRFEVHALTSQGDQLLDQVLDSPAVPGLWQYSTSWC
jgi:hypothetical protein